MTVHQAFRFELDPNNRAISQLSSHCGASRFAYNTMLAYVIWAVEARAFEKRTTGQPSTQVPWNLYSLRKVWNNEVKSWAAPWWAENSKEAYNSGLDSLARALDAFSTSRKGARKGRRVGFPRFKGKNAHKSYRISTGAFGVVDKHHVKIPRIGVVRTKEPTIALTNKIAAGTAHILSATISSTADRWFISFGCEVERDDATAVHLDAVVGVDLGVGYLAVVSTGEFVENPKALNRYRRRVDRLQRELSRRKKGPKRRAKTTKSLARCHARVCHVRGDAIHKLTSYLAAAYGTVVIEDLNVAGMTAAPKSELDDAGTFARNGRRAKAGLNRAILDASPGEFRRQLTYKVDWHRGRLVVADRFFPSAKTCSSCGSAKAKLSLAPRIYRCEICGVHMDRDLNAAKNLAAYGRRVLDVAVSGTETHNARGGGHHRLRPKPPVKREDGTGQPDRFVTAVGQPAAPELVSEVA
ncbi:MAG: IS607 family element RNA-guided endonuclease TnpB [Actinomycetota bacterium]|nr:IS607 family element RNA-guided endonuclease TnpB [Actinomycetota bacterium]